MLFNSLEFAIFLPIVFGLYWLLADRSLRVSNLFLVVVSYFFYGWWDWRFLGLIIFSSTVDYLIGRQLGRTDHDGQRKRWLLLSLFTNLGLLGFFKYYNFFADNFAAAFTFLGRPVDPFFLDIILPVGISFYTFQTLSYTIDVYRRKMEPTKDVVAFFAFVSFFPQLVAGPIERATDLLPQFFRMRRFDVTQATDGMRQILWGLFKKIVIADNCARFANDIFANYDTLNGSTLLLGAFFFTFQIYGDFSGYSDIAIGTARLFGFRLRQNFNFPYFSRDIAEFWRRWHISLNTWFRDYLYIPLGGSRGSTTRKIRNIFIIFLVSGFWHGANWTYIVWGGLNACYFLPLMLSGNNRRYLGPIAEGRRFPSFRECVAVFTTFWLTVLAWIFFRSETLEKALYFIRKIFSSSLFEPPAGYGERSAQQTLALIAIFLGVEWWGRKGRYALERSVALHRLSRWILYLTVALMIFTFGYFNKTEFIYFAF